MVLLKNKIIIRFRWEVNIKYKEAYSVNIHLN